MNSYTIRRNGVEKIINRSDKLSASSAAKLLDEKGSGAFFDYKTKKENTPALNFGCAYHFFVAHPEIESDSSIIVYSNEDRPNKKAKDGKENEEWRQAMIDKKNEDKNIEAVVTEEELDKILKMRSKLYKSAYKEAGMKAYPVIDMVNEGKKELWLPEDFQLFDHGINGRLDLHLERLSVVIDWKTMADISIKNIQKAAIEHEWCMQAYIYMQAFNANCFVFVIQDKNDHSVDTRSIMRDSQEFRYGEHRIKKAIELYEKMFDSEVFEFCHEGIDNLFFKKDLSIPVYGFDAEFRNKQ